MLPVAPRATGRCGRLAAAGGPAAGAAQSRPLRAAGDQPEEIDPPSRTVEMWRVRRHATPGPAPRAALSATALRSPYRASPGRPFCGRPCSLSVIGAAEPVKQQAAPADPELTSLCRALPARGQHDGPPHAVAPLPVRGLLDIGRTRHWKPAMQCYSAAATRSLNAR